MHEHINDIGLRIEAVIPNVFEDHRFGDGAGGVAHEIFEQVYLVDKRSDDPEQYRAIGWCCGRLCSVIFEIRHDNHGEYYRLITAWKATKEEEQIYAENT